MLYGICGIRNLDMSNHYLSVNADDIRMSVRTRAIGTHLVPILPRAVRVFQSN